jgi:hypothetical protein
MSSPCPAGPSQPMNGGVHRLPGERPLAVIGDVHGRADLLEELLDAVYALYPTVQLVSVGDLCDRGPDSPGVYALMREEIANGAQLVASNHGASMARKVGKLLDQGLDVAAIAAELTSRALTAERAGRPQANTSQVAATVRQFAALSDGHELLAWAVAAEQAAPFQLHAHGQRTLIVHGGVTPELVGKATSEARQVALYGTPKGTDPVTGLPSGRDSWVEGYEQAATRRTLPLVIYGHVARDEPRLTARTVGIDLAAGKEAHGRVAAAIVSDGRLVDLLVSSGSVRQRLAS